MITLTPKAADHIQQSLNKRGQGLGLRVGVKPSGCSGLSYVIEYADQAESFDKVFESNGVKIFVDEKSLAFLEGTELDFAREGLNEGFKFNNPNAKGQCGCGESFAV